MRVFLIHGMGRSPSSFVFLARRLRREGHLVSRFGYAVRNTSLDVIADRFVTHVTRVIEDDGVGTRYAIVAHSLGNVITRLASAELPAGFARFAMLAPPNRPPLLAKLLKKRSIFRALTGDAGQRLADAAFFSSLPVPDVPTIIVAGDAAKGLTVLPFEGAAADGIVSVDETRLADTPHTVVSAWHTVIMNHPEVGRVLDDFLDAD